MFYKKNIKTISIFLIFLLIFTNIYLLYEITNLNKNYDDLETKLNKYKKDYNLLSEKNLKLKNKIHILENDYNNLNEKYNDLNQEYKKTLTSKENITKEYENISKDYNNLVYDLNNFREDIKDSMDWFKDNSNLEKLDNETIKHTIDISLNDCIIKEDNYTKIKLACFVLKNQKALKLSYSEDKIITNKEDKLQSLNSFLENRKGDCEDFSLLFTAQLRYTINKLIDTENIIIEPTISTDTTKKYYIDEDRDWYFDSGVEGIEFENYKYPYVACGEVYDPQTQKINGHCLVIISKNQINDINNLKKVDAIAIEPQNGDFVGILNQKVNIKDKTYSIYLIDKINDYNQDYISLIITKDNLINYNFKKEKWESYNLFLEKTKNLN